MVVAVPYKDFKSHELKYCLRGIEKYVQDPEVIIIGDCPAWLQNISHVPYKDNPEYQYKERNIFEKIMLMEGEFLFFNDDHFLLKPFNKGTYHYSGTITECLNSYHISNSFRKTLANTMELYGDIKNYYRHAPIFINRILLESLKELDWDKPWGYCIKSIYCHINDIEGTEYPDLKFRHPAGKAFIEKEIKGRDYFSTDNGAVNADMIKGLENLYPHKSKFEK